MRIIVCGGRNYKDAARIYLTLEEYVREEPTVVHGAAPGADSIAAREATVLELATEPRPAEWDRYGKAAGPIRNQAMVDSGADLLIAFGGGVGTADCIKRARKAGIPVRWEP
jgi:hypothetical protein